MDKSSDHLEDVEMEAAVLQSAADREQAPAAGTEAADSDMVAHDQVAADADADMTAHEQPAVADIEVVATPPESATGVTAYFLFANVHREKVKAALQAALPESGKVTIGMVGKKIGDIWKQCTDEVKQAYAEKAKLVCSWLHTRLRPDSQ
jgi:hypothetical protein